MLVGQAKTPAGRLPSGWWREAVPARPCLNGGYSAVLARVGLAGNDRVDTASDLTARYCPLPAPDQTKPPLPAAFRPFASVQHPLLPDVTVRLVTIIRSWRGGSTPSHPTPPAQPLVMISLRTGSEGSLARDDGRGEKWGRGRRFPSAERLLAPGSSSSGAQRPEDPGGVSASHGSSDRCASEDDEPRGWCKPPPQPSRR